MREIERGWETTHLGEVLGVIIAHASPVRVDQPRHDAHIPARALHAQTLAFGCGRVDGRVCSRVCDRVCSRVCSARVVSASQGGDLRLEVVGHLCAHMHERKTNRNNCRDAALIWLLQCILGDRSPSSRLSCPSSICLCQKQLLPSLRPLPASAASWYKSLQDASGASFLMATHSAMEKHGGKFLCSCAATQGCLPVEQHKQLYLLSSRA